MVHHPFAPVLVMKDPNTFLFNACQCIHGEAFKACAVLTCLGLLWSEDLKCVIQPQLKRVVVYSDIEALAQKNISVLGKHKLVALHHLQTACDLRPGEDQAALWERQHRAKEVASPIVGLVEPIRRYQCNVCGKWYARLFKHRHVLKFEDPDHSANIRETPSRFTIQLYQTTCYLSLCVPLSSRWKPKQNSKQDPRVKAHPHMFPANCLLQLKSPPTFYGSAGVIILIAWILIVFNRFYV
jgi:hypothetical protein